MKSARSVLQYLYPVGECCALAGFQAVDVVAPCYITVIALIVTTTHPGFYAYERGVLEGR